MELWVLRASDLKLRYGFELGVGVPANYEVLIYTREGPS
jgi:hypothetical protein